MLEAMERQISHDMARMDEEMAGVGISSPSSVHRPTLLSVNLRGGAKRMDIEIDPAPNSVSPISSDNVFFVTGSCFRHGFLTLHLVLVSHRSALFFRQVASMSRVVFSSWFLTLHLVWFRIALHCSFVSCFHVMVSCCSLSCSCLFCKLVSFLVCLYRDCVTCLEMAKISSGPIRTQRTSPHWRTDS